MEESVNNHRKLKFIGLATACLLLVIAFTYGPTDNWSWDPSFYYAHMRSPIIDGDLNFYNDTQTPGVEIPPTATGLQPSIHPIGPAILWSPFFLVAHLITTISHPSQADGLSLPYIAAVSIASMVYTALGILLIYKLTRRYSDRFTAIIACLLCLTATPLFFYVFRQPISAHGTTLLITACMVWVFILLDEERLPIHWSGLLFGTLLGLVFINRWSGILMGIYPFVFFLKRGFLGYRKGKLVGLAPILIQLAITIGALFIAISPQLMVWQQIYGNFLVFPQPNTMFNPMFITNLKEINLLPIFFATNRGLLTWAPFILVGMAGLFLIKDKSLKIAAIVHALLLVILLSTRTDWFGGGLFGVRYVLEILPALAIGFVSLWTAIPLREGKKQSILVLFSALVITHQFVLMHAVEFGIDPGWIDLKNYLEGKPVGLRFQWQSALRLLREPTELLAPRPYVAEERQAILVNILAGVRDLRNYSIQLVAIFVTPLLAASIYLLDKYFKIKYIQYLMAILLASIVSWSAFLLFLL